MFVPFATSVVLPSSLTTTAHPRLLVPVSIPRILSIRSIFMLKDAVKIRIYFENTKLSSIFALSKISYILSQ